MKKRVDPFGDTKTKVSEETLPERGTGLERGNAGERRGGKPRTEEERVERHAVKETFIAPGPIPPKSLTEQWADHRKNKGKK